MIKDLDDTIRKLILERCGFSSTEVEISFKPPTADWQAGLTRPTINCYLYDIVENLELRETSPEYEKKYQDRIVIRRGRPLRVDVTYFVTAWTTEVEDEHEILWRVLSALANANPLPEELLEGRLAEQPFPLATRAAYRNDELPKLTDVWTVMNTEYRPTINYTVTVALERTLEEPIPMVFAKRLEFNAVPKGREEATLTQIAGVVYEEPSRRPIAGAEVVHVERGTRVETDEFGRYSLTGLTDREHRLRLTVNGVANEHRIRVGPLENTLQFDLSCRL
jgi:hypothetical protein